MEQHRQKRLKTASSDDASSNDPVLPPIPVLKVHDVSLNEDVMAKIYVELLDPATYCSATALSKAHHAALVPRQTHVWLGGFESLERFRRMNFCSVEFLSLRNCDFATKHVLQSIANAFPKLQGFDFTGADPFSAHAETAEFIDYLGPRLKSFVCLGYLSPSIRSALVRQASTLTSVKLSMGGSNLGYLKNLTSLQELSFEPNIYLFLLVSDLPESIQVLRVRRCGKVFEWKHLKSVRLPNLVKLEISDLEIVRYSTVSLGERIIPAQSDLSAEVLIAIMSKAPLLKSFRLNALSKAAPLYNGKAEEQEERLFRYMQERGIHFVGPEHVTEACGASAAMFQQWRDRRK
jgi:hypothetical protein